MGVTPHLARRADRTAARSGLLDWPAWMASIERNGLEQFLHASAQAGDVGETERFIRSPRCWRWKLTQKRWLRRGRRRRGERLRKEACREGRRGE